MNEGDLSELKPQLCKEFVEIESLYSIKGKVGEGQYAQVFAAEPLPQPGAELDENGKLVPPKTTTSMWDDQPIGTAPIGGDRSKRNEKSNALKAQQEFKLPQGFPQLAYDRVAIKIVKKRKRGIVHAVREEVSILQDVRHPNILKLINVHESELELYIVTELLDGGSLFERVAEGRLCGDEEASSVARQMAAALRSIHRHGIIHRDVKPANVLFTSSAPGVSGVKLIDFGAAVRMQKDVEIDKQVGTVKYMAPEMANKHEYDHRVDMWSLGVLLYVALSGQEPFTGHGSMLYAAIRKGDYAMPSPEWDRVSPMAKETVRALLKRDPSARVSAADMFKLGWIKRPGDQFMEWDLTNPQLKLPPKPQSKRAKFRIAAWTVRLAIRMFHLPQGKGSRKSRPQTLAPLPSATGPQGRSPRHTGDPTQLRAFSGGGGRCANCKRPCVSGFMVFGHVYHDGCLMCRTCMKPINEEGAFQAYQGQAHHRACLARLNAQDPWRAGPRLPALGGSSEDFSQQGYSQFETNAPYMEDSIQLESRPHSSGGGRPMSSGSDKRAHFAPEDDLIHTESEEMAKRLNMAPPIDAHRGPPHQHQHQHQHHQQHQPPPLRLSPLQQGGGGGSHYAPPKGHAPAHPQNPQVGTGGGRGHSPVGDITPHGPPTAKFCHECGTKYVSQTAKFCIECGVRRV